MLESQQMVTHLHTSTSVSTATFKAFYDDGRIVLKFHAFNCLEVIWRGINQTSTVSTVVITVKCRGKFWWCLKMNILS